LHYRLYFDIFVIGYNKYDPTLQLAFNVASLLGTTTDEVITGKK